METSFGMNIQKNQVRKKWTMDVGHFL